MVVCAAWDHAVWRVIRLTIEGQWTWDEYFAATDSIIKLMETIDSQVDFILEVRSASVPADGVRYIERASVYFRHPQAGHAVIVGAQGYVRILLTVFSRVYPSAGQRLLFAPTLIDAYPVLMKHYLCRSEVAAAHSVA
jgi:hypothetical protein